MTDDVPLFFWVFLSLVIVGAGWFMHPDHAACPMRWHNNGIRPSGEFECTRNPVGDPDWDGTYWDGVQRPDRSRVPTGELRGRIYCTGGMHPIVVSDRVLGCQR